MVQPAEGQIALERCKADGVAQSGRAAGKWQTMKPPEDSRMADEKAAIGLQRKKPSWRATKPVNDVPTKLPGSEHLALLVEAGLITLLFLIGWILGVR